MLDGAAFLAQGPQQAVHAPAVVPRRDDHMQERAPRRVGVLGHRDVDPGGAGLRELGRKNGIDGHIAGLEQGVDRLQAPVQLLEVGDGPFDLPGLQLALERLQMVVEVVLIAAHLVMDAPDLLQMLPRLLLLHFDQPEIGSLQHGISSVSAVLSFCQ